MLKGLFLYGERVTGVSQNISGLSRNGQSLAITTKVLTRRFLGWEARYRKCAVVYMIFLQ